MSLWDQATRDAAMREELQIHNNSRYIKQNPELREPVNVENFYDRDPDTDDTDDDDDDEE